MQRIGILINRMKEGAATMAEEIRRYLAEKGALGLITDGEGEIPDGISCLLVVGGDGTLLRAAKRVVDRQIPLLGVNLGTLGYLAEVEAGNVRPAIDQLLSGRYSIEKRMMLEGEIERDGRRVAGDVALNDVSIVRCGPLRVLHFRSFVNGAHLTDYRADGIILSTPTGSTGYSLSVGGPIVTPEADLLLLTPIASHTLASRSIILRGSDEVTVEIGQGYVVLPAEAEVSFDGNTLLPLMAGDLVNIRRTRQKTNIIKLSDDSFLEVLRRKMVER